VVQVTDGAGTVLRSNTIDGGSPQGASGASLLQVGSTRDAASTVDIENNDFRAGAPKATAASGVLRKGIGVEQSAKVSIRGNRIQGAALRCTQCGVIGVQVSHTSVVTMRNNFIDTGDIALEGTTPSAYTRPVVVEGVATLVAEQNVILQPTLPPTGGSSFIALAVIGQCTPPTSSTCTITSSPKATFRHNTVHIGPAGGPGTGVSGLYAEGLGIVLENNLFFGDNPIVGMQTFGCYGGTFASLKGNAFVVNTFRGGELMREGGCPQAGFATIAAAEKTLGDTSASGNATYLGLEGALGAPGTWRSGFFERALDLKSFTDTGLCGIARTTRVLQDLNVDIAGRTRNATRPSAGAYEYQGASCP
jgi:hypothetical protein